MRRVLLVVGLSMMLSACGGLSRGGYYKHDGPPRYQRVNVSRVPDAVPRYEPLSDTGNDPYTVNGKTYYPVKTSSGYRERGVASWYGRMFHGRRTSSGESYDMYAMTAAHRTLPLPSYARVRNLRNGKQVVLKINDRGPFLHNRLIDLSYAAAYRLGIVDTGTGLVEVVAVGPDTMIAEKQIGVPVTSALPRPPSIYIQVGAFSERDNAERMRRQLYSHTYGPVITQHARVNGGDIHRVRVGPIATVDEADNIVRRMQWQGYHPTLVVE
jgi:rare lipoprotein A